LRSFCSSRPAGRAARLFKVEAGIFVRARLLETLIHGIQTLTWRRGSWAALLGLVALAINALVPVHLAFDLADAFGLPQCSARAMGENAERHILALVGGHREVDGKSHEHHKHQACPVCSALNALAGFVPPTLPTLSFPLSAGLSAAHFVIQAERVDVSVVYHSRAPPPA